MCVFYNEAIFIKLATTHYQVKKKIVGFARDSDIQAIKMTNGSR